MVEFLGGRLLRMGITLWAIASVVFLATRLTGNPIDFLMPEGLDAASRREMIAYWGLDRSVAEQYWLFWRSLLSGDFGLGLMERRPVATIFTERLWQSASLLVATLALTICVGVPVGILAAVWRGQARGSAVLFTAFLGYAIPNFVLAILLLLVFSYTLHWLPSAGSATFAHYIMPTVALSAYFVAALVRYTRNAMLDVLSQDYMRTARAKGLPESSIILHHGLRNALIPVITVLGLQITTLVSGAVVVETVFAWNGVGDLLVGATLRRDYPVLQFGVLVVASAVIVVNLLVDLAYALVDPRVRLAGA
ncbi:putative oligopeptide ABC superfamily (Permease protein) [Bosea sp. LC85]|uniref:ABC transporter permease n=1 Tax=Bosea sp. LC85 TaxID=1502851 RepID=UPI0004E359E1|nr:ABC transporter permease [Bosea sp. LC85]KFC64094.1 putative oligopeptide ABC superfamily (Permease protein) [Bosea sp. LC85]